MLPTLSSLSVNHRPAGRLRHWYSSQYLRISPLHWEFYPPLRDSSLAVSKALPRLGRGLSLQTYETTCARFTPNDSEQRLHSPYYRGCWHGVSQCFLRGYRQGEGVTPAYSFPPTGLYNPKAFVTHAASLRQAFAHCAKFPTAASRRSLDRVSVPVWLIILSDQLPIEGLVSHYLTNYLMGRGLIHRRVLAKTNPLFPQPPQRPWSYLVLAFLSERYPKPSGRLPTCYSPVRRFTEDRSPVLARLACVRRAASVRSEPGSNSPVS